MRIAYALTSLGVGGAERLTSMLAARMTQRGHSVAILVLRPRQPGNLACSLPVTSLEMVRRPLSFVAGMARAGRFLREFRPDLVHSHSFHANMLARGMRCFGCKVPVLSTVHNVYEGGRSRMLAYRWTDRWSRRTVTVSAATAERFTGLSAIPLDKCTVIPNAIELAEFEPNLERRAHGRAAMGVAGEFVWLAVGRAAPAKDYSTLLHAFAHAQKPCPEAQLWIAGAAFPDSEPLRSLAFRPDLADSVRWLGMRHDVAALLDAADGFVMSSAWEGMPLAIAEAMAMEKPVVATDVGGMRELLGSMGTLVGSRNPEELAAAMVATMRLSHEARVGLGQQARRRIEERFSMDTRIETWERLYSEVIAAR